MNNNRQMNDQQRELVVRAMGYADSIAAKYQHKGIPLDDLRQEARLALCYAAMRFSPENDCELSTYSTLFINGWLCKFIMQHGQQSYLSKNQRFFVRITSLDNACCDDEDDDVSWEDALSCEADREERAREEALETVAFLMEHLTPDERRIVSLHVGFDNDPVELAELAAQMDISEKCMAKRYREIKNKLAACAEEYKLFK